MPFCGFRRIIGWWQRESLTYWSDTLSDDNYFHCPDCWFTGESQKQVDDHRDRKHPGKNKNKKNPDKTENE